MNSYMEKMFGINERVKGKLKKFSVEELHIIDMFARKYWRVTRAENISLSNSVYKTILIKPTPTIVQNFNLRREVVVVFSPYDEFQPRAIDAVDYMETQKLRLEEICFILICKDLNVENRVSELIQSNQEARVIVPFSYQELLENEYNEEFINSRIRKHFYSRDLFGIQDALRKELYFFGRKDLLQTLVNKHLNNENIGIFGLRKTGKTSILYGVQRALNRKKSMSVFIDCQTLHLKDWNMALYTVISELFKVSDGVKINMIHSVDDYKNDSFVPDYFEQDIKVLCKKSKRMALLIFDEVEHISVDTSISEGWRNGDYFIKFWQVIRSTFQKDDKGYFSYLITGTNPRCVEKATIGTVDNPIFMQFTPLYIPPFNYEQTSEMVNKLGGYMGITFDESVCSLLVEDFGGHPLLIRQFCSYVHQNTMEERPHQVIKAEYLDMKAKFYVSEIGFKKYAEMVLEVLRNWYEDEYQMLCWLSVGDDVTFNGLAEMSSSYVDHLKKYGIVDEYKGKYYFKNEALKLYLSNKNKYQKLHMSSEERQQEISLRRNKIEPKLRKIVRTQLRVSLGEEDAKKQVIKEIYGSDKVNRYLNRNYTDLFNPQDSPIYFKSLINLITRYWDDCFKNIFGGDVETFKAKARLINYNRKADAHATDISEADFKSFRGAMEWLENVINDYFEM